MKMVTCFVLVCGAGLVPLVFRTSRSNADGCGEFTFSAACQVTVATCSSNDPEVCETLNGGKIHAGKFYCYGGAPQTSLCWDHMIGEEVQMGPCWSEWQCVWFEKTGCGRGDLKIQDHENPLKTNDPCP